MARRRNLTGQGRKYGGDTAAVGKGKERKG